MNHHKLMSLEVPAALLEKLHPLLDFHFVIATELEKNNLYHAWYYEHGMGLSSPKKFTMLDNGMYEEGEPMEIDTLIDLGRSIAADVIFSPDWFEDANFTFNELKAFFSEKTYPFITGFVPQGRTSSEIVSCLRKALDTYGRGIGIIGLSFRSNREEVCLIIEAERLPQKYPWIWWHFLGIRNINDIPDIPPWVKSYDTVKPIKAALHNLQVEDMLRGMGKWDSGIQIKDYSLLYRNIARMRVDYKHGGEL